MISLQIIFQKCTMKCRKSHVFLVSSLWTKQDIVVFWSGWQGFLAETWLFYHAHPVPIRHFLRRFLWQPCGRADDRYVKRENYISVLKKIYVSLIQLIDSQAREGIYLSSTKLRPFAEWRFGVGHFLSCSVLVTLSFRLRNNWGERNARYRTPRSTKPSKSV